MALVVGRAVEVGHDVEVAERLRGRRERRRRRRPASPPRRRGPRAAPGTMVGDLGQRADGDGRPSATTPSRIATRHRDGGGRAARRTRACRRPDPTPATAAGIRIATMTSSGSRAVNSGPRTNSPIGELALARRPGEPDGRAAGQQEGRRIRVRLGEGQVAAQRAGVPDPDVGDALPRGRRGPARASRTTVGSLDRRGGSSPAPMRTAVAVARRSVMPWRSAIPLRSMRRAELGEAHLHDLQELGAAGDEGGVARRRRRRRRMPRRAVRGRASEKRGITGDLERGRVSQDMLAVPAMIPAAAETVGTIRLILSPLCRRVRHSLRTPGGIPCPTTTSSSPARSSRSAERRSPR